MDPVDPATIRTALSLRHVLAAFVERADAGDTLAAAALWDEVERAVASVSAVAPPPPPIPFPADPARGRVWRFDPDAARLPTGSGTLRRD